MKIDRLLSIIVYLLNRELAGIPIMSVQGPHGGYGIVDTYKMDRQFVTVDDLFYMFVDFSMLGGGGSQPELLRSIERAVEESRLLQITYTNNKLESSQRIVEAMSLVFNWRSWYLFAYCRSRKDYRLFRLSRIKDPKILPQRFRPRDKDVGQFPAQTASWNWGKTVDLPRESLNFHFA